MKSMYGKYSLLQIGKVATAMALLLTLCFGLVGCGSSGDDASNSSNAEQSSMRQMDDALGTLEVNNEADRIAACSAAHWSSVIMLGAGDKLVAMEEGYGKNEWLQKKFPDLADLPVVFSSNEVDMEALLATDPDLVFYASRYGDDFRSQLEDNGIPYVSDPNLGEDFSYLERIKEKQVYYGEAIGGVSAEIAQRYADEFSSVHDEIQAKTASLSEDEKPVVLQITSADPLTITDGSNISQEWITLAGGINAGEQATGEAKTSGRVETTAEQVLSWDPDYLIVDNKKTYEAIMGDAALANVTAVKNGNVVIMPTGMMSWGYHGSEEILMMPFVAKLLHPDLFSDIDMVTRAKDFYSNYYGIQLDDDDIKYIFQTDGSVEDLFK